MSGNTGMMIGMAAIGFAAPFAAAAVPGVAGATGAATSLGQGASFASVAGAHGFGTALAASVSAMSPLTLAMTGAGLGMAMTAQQPQMPSFDQQFAYQQANLDFEQSMARRSDAELEDILLNGDEWQKNDAFSELKMRGADELRLQEIATRKERSEQNQADIDAFQAANRSLTPDEIEERAAQLAAIRLASFDEDVEEERTRLKQISAGRGTLDSNRNDALNLRLASIASKNRGDIENAALNTALQFEKGVSDIRNQGLARLIQGATFDETQNRFNVQMAEAERRYQEQLRQSANASQRNLAFQRFQSQQNLALANFNQQSQNARNQGVLGLGLAGFGVSGMREATPTFTPSSDYLSAIDRGIPFTENYYSNQLI